MESNNHRTLNNFEDFCIILRECGFSMGGGNPKGIFAVIDFDWKEQEFVDSPIKWHTGNPETDPWEWRMRVLYECDDIAYSKLFFKTSGYITLDWYPYFYAARRQGADFDYEYRRGRLGDAARRIYEVVSDGEVALHELKRLAHFTRDENSRFERALIELQMKMYITMCGETRKLGLNGREYGWSSTMFTTVEDFWQSRGHSLPICDAEESFERIRDRILELNPSAEQRTIERFIYG